MTALFRSFIVHPPNQPGMFGETKDATFILAPLEIFGYVSARSTSRYDNLNSKKHDQLKGTLVKPLIRIIVHVRRLI